MVEPELNQLLESVSKTQVTSPVAAVRVPSADVFADAFCPVPVHTMSVAPLATQAKVKFSVSVNSRAAASIPSKVFASLKLMFACFSAAEIFDCASVTRALPA